MRPSSTSRLKPNAAITALLAVLAMIPVLLYVLGLGGGFIFDDYPNLVHDPHWRLTAITLSDLAEAMGNGSSGLGGRPLAVLTFALDHLRAGADATAMKATNVAMHALNTALVFLLVRSLSYFAWRTKTRVARVEIFAIVVAVGWALHPLQVSTVLYIVQRMEVGASTFILVTCLAYVRARTRQIAGASGLVWLGVAAASTAVGFGFKESAILAPLFAAVIEALVFRFAGPPPVARSLKTLLAVGVALGMTLFAAVVVPHYATLEQYEIRDFNAYERVLTQGPVLAHYISQILWPLPSRLLFYYDNFPVSHGLLSPPWTIGAWVVLAGLVACAALVRDRLPLVSFGIAWFFSAHFLTSNVVPLELVFEHRNYMALLGLLIAVADVARYTSRHFNMDARLVAAAAVLITLVGLSTLQIMTWADPMRLATSLASRNIESPRASYELGRQLFEDSRNNITAPSWSLAKRELLHAAHLGGRSPLPEQALIIMHAHDGTPLPPDIWPRLHAKYANNPLTPEGENAIWQLATCRQLSKCPIDTQLLLETLMATLERNPNSATLHSIYATFAYNVLQDSDLGIAMMREAIKLAPKDTQFKANLARLLACRPNTEPEIAVLARAVREANLAGTYTEDLEAIRSRLESCGRHLQS